MLKEITIYTLVDITPTKAVRVRDSNTKAYHQFQNMNVLLQVLALRTQIMEYEIESFVDSDMEDFNFAKQYDNEYHTVWKMTFRPDHPEVWADTTDPIAHLKTDINGVAFTAELDDTAFFEVSAFDTASEINTYFEYK